MLIKATMQWQTSTPSQRLITAIYEQIAVEYDTTVSKVERGIRNAVQCCNTGKKEELFGQSHLSNSNFIAELADLCLLEYRAATEQEAQ